MRRGGVHRHPQLGGRGKGGKDGGGGGGTGPRDRKEGLISMALSMSAGAQGDKVLAAERQPAPCLRRPTKEWSGVWTPLPDSDWGRGVCRKPSKETKTGNQEHWGMRRMTGVGRKLTCTRDGQGGDEEDGSLSHLVHEPDRRAFERVLLG